MSLKVLFITSTDTEAAALKNVRGMKQVKDKFNSGSLEIELLIGGVGAISTAWNMSQWLAVNMKPDLAINVGIAGSYREEFPVGSVVMPVTDCFADAGIEDGDKFITLYEAGLAGKDEFPFRNGLLHSENRYCEELREILNTVDAITVNTATGSEKTKKRLILKFNPGIETMEGAAFFYICARERIPFVAIRSVSNMVEKRDRDKWNIPLAIDNLTFALEKVFKKLNR
ncbi:MAG: futalosine hydrolase [Bacteroidetes bacterium]|nr:futalosine hydrolase [Bacteroidota bacterium]